MTAEQIIACLQQDLKPERFLHTLGVAETARALAKNYGADEEKAYLAGLLHDCAKNIPHERLFTLCTEYGVELDAVSRLEGVLLHPYVGAHLAREKFGVDDDEIFDAIYFHTVAKEDMPLLTKIIFLADTIEPNRRFEGELELLRTLAYHDLDAALIRCLDLSIQHVIRKGDFIHPNSINARNFLLAARVNQESKGENVV